MSAITNKSAPQRQKKPEPSGTKSVEGADDPFTSTESREQFYQDYRDAVRALLRGEPERFIAYQSDPRITPPREHLTLPPRPQSEPPTRGPETTPTQALTETQFSMISVMSSVREMITVLGRFLT
jgi:hypothetical protein